MAKTPGEVARAATARFATFSNTKPDLIPTGLGPLDRKIGGLTPQMVGLMAAARGVTKSSLALYSALNSPVKVGILSMEDPEEEVGLRMLSARTGINGLKIRKKDLTKAEKQSIAQAQEELDAETGVVLAFRVGASINAMIEGIDELGEAGCRLIWCDYAQKPGGHRENRKDEVAMTYKTAATQIAKYDAAGVVLSQITDSLETKRPRIVQVRDSRDLINEARFVIMGWRDDSDPKVIHYSLDKSMVGGDGLRWSMRRDASGTLREMDDDFDHELEF